MIKTIEMIAKKAGEEVLEIYNSMSSIEVKIKNDGASKQ